MSLPFFICCLAIAMNLIEREFNLPGKTRDRYKEGKYPENTENIVISNTSPLDADISFCFQNDSTAATFILDPPNMKLKPGESQVSDVRWCSMTKKSHPGLIHHIRNSDLR